MFRWTRVVGWYSSVGSRPLALALQMYDWYSRWGRRTGTGG